MRHYWHERALMSLAGRFQLNPSNWLPHLTADGLYEMGTRYSGTESDADFWDLENAERVPIPCLSLYSAFWLVCWRRRGKRNGTGDYDIPTGRAGFWEELWSFLSDVDMGVFDTTNWVPVEPPGETR